jgi:hypothetical protein
MPASSRLEKDGLSAGEAFLKHAYIAEWMEGPKAGI